MIPAEPVNVKLMFHPVLKLRIGTTQEARISPALPPMLRRPSAVPLSSELNQFDTSFTPGTNIPAPSNPVTKRSNIAW